MIALNLFEAHNSFDVEASSFGEEFWNFINFWGAVTAMESLRLALSAFPALVASAAPSRIDRQLREIAAALAALHSPEEIDAEEDATVHLLLDTFCLAHAEDHMSDHTKLGSWRLPYVAMVHSHDSLHLPLIKQLEALLQHSSEAASLGPAQCSALATFMLFMSPCQVQQKDDTSNEDMYDGKANDRILKNCHVKVLFTWSWEACFRARDEEQDGGASERGRYSGDHWMEQFCDAFLMDCEANILWFARFAASYLRNVAVYWEHVLFRSKTWLLSEHLKGVTLVGPIFVAFVPQTMVTFLFWLQQRLDFALQFTEETSPNLKKALALCETVLASPLGVLLRSTKLSVSMSRFFELELRAGWSVLALSKSRRLFLRSVVWGGSFTDHSSWGLLWKDYGGDKTRACIALASVFLTSQCLKENAVEEQLSTDVPQSSWSGTKKQCVRAEAPELQNWFLWLKASKASPAEVDILQIITELSSKLETQCGPWFLEAAFDCLSNQARLENSISVHCESCAYAHKCKSRLWNSGVCSAHRLKSCIAAVPPSHVISYERLYKMEKVFMFCWLGDGPFSVDFATQLLSYFHTSQTTGVFLKEENPWSTLLLATWVRYFNVIAAPILSLHHTVGGTNLGSILSHLHNTQKFLTSNSVNDTLDMDALKVAAMAMPELAAVTLIESLFTCTNASSRDGFLASLATKASPQQHEISRRAEELFTELQPEDGARSFVRSLLFNLADLSSMAVIASPDLILKKWAAFEYKRKWVQSSEERSKPSLLSMASIELEFDERIGKPKRSTWDILLEWVISLVTLDPCQLKAAGGVSDGPKALMMLVVVAGLPRETVSSLGNANNWSLLLSQMRVGLEHGFRRLFLGDGKPDLSAVKAEMELYLRQLQKLNKVIVL